MHQNIIYVAAHSDLDLWVTFDPLPSHFKSNQIYLKIQSVKQDFKAGKPAITEALNTIKDETKQHKIQKLNELYGNMQMVTMHNNQTDEKHKGCNLRLNTATDHEETMSLGNVFQMLFH